MRIRKITVEILRAGPRHNQLLSPLTQYLAVCEDSPAGIVTLPAHYEHASFERRLDELRYTVTPDEHGAARLQGLLHQTGTEMAQFLGAIPGLAGALRSDPGPRSTLTHLRIVSSASELSLLPFELSKTPSGSGASPDSWLGVQSPVCVTRHNRAVRTEGVVWPTKPRLLFVSGPGVEGAFEQHLAALHEALRPWTGDPEGDGWLTVLENAALHEVEEAMAQRPTHVHILAHGRRHEDRYARHGVQLENGTVSGEQLASALTHVGEQDAHLPTIVTLATCDSGNAGGVVTPDASVAHALHEQGIPFVVASQFPLSMDGSIPFAQAFYEKQLWGENPLQTIYEVRLRLHGPHSSYYHDWASLAVYEALPTDFDHQLEELRYRQVRRALKKALDRVEAAVADHCQGGASDEDWSERYNRLLGEVHKTRERLPSTGRFVVDGYGSQATCWKRLAEAEWRFSRMEETHEAGRPFVATCYQNLQNSLVAYKKILAALFAGGGEIERGDATIHWVLTQVASISLVIDDVFMDARWMDTARLSAETDLAGQLGDGRVWAHVNLIELSLLALTDASLWPAEDAGEEDVAALAARREEHTNSAIENAAMVLNLVPRTSIQVASTIRQLRRYVDWYSDEEFDNALVLLTDDMVDPKPHWRFEGGLLDTAMGLLWLFGSDPEDGYPEDASRAEEIAEMEPGELSDLDDYLADEYELETLEAPEDASDAAPAVPGLLAAPTNGVEVGAEPERVVAPAPVPDDAIFTIEMLPAREGDSLWIEYGDPAAPHRVLIDCGRKSTADLLLDRVADLGEVHFDLFVMTHIDRDHIEGAIPFLEQLPDGVTFGDVWFNGWEQIRNLLGVRQGDRFSDVLEEKQLPWNRLIPNGSSDKPPPVVIPDNGALPTITLAGGMKLTLLSPDSTGLKRLATVYKRELKKIAPQKLLRSKEDRPKPIDPASYNVKEEADKAPKKDPSIANESSIAFLAEYADRAVLFTGDAHAGLLEASIRRFQAQHDAKGEKLRLDAHKVSHHGSASAVTKELLELTDCSRYLVSTDGSGHYHPDRPAIARIVLHGGDHPELYFNYHGDLNGMWGLAELQERYPGYTTHYPAEGTEGLLISL